MMDPNEYEQESEAYWEEMYWQYMEEEHEREIEEEQEDNGVK